MIDSHHHLWSCAPSGGSPEKHSDAKRLAIVHQDPSILALARNLLEKERCWNPIDSHLSMESALPILIENPPEVLLIGFQKPNQSFMTFLGRFRDACPGSSVLVVSRHPQPSPVADLFKSGVSGYLLERDLPSRLCSSMIELVEGGFPISSFLSNLLLQQHNPNPAVPVEFAQLTAREGECLRLMAEALLYKEIAWELGISHETVRKHVRSLYQKLNVRSRTEAVVKFLSKRVPHAS